MVWAVVLTVLCHQIWLLRRRRYFDALAIETIVDAAVLVICGWGLLVDERSAFLADHDPAFRLAILGGILALYAGMHLRVKPYVIREDVVVTEGADERVLWGCVVVFALLTGVLLRDSAARAGGLAAWLFGARNVVYGEGLEAGVPTLLYNIMVAARAGVLVFLAAALRKRAWTTALGLYLLLLFAIFVIFVTRLELVITLWLPLAYYHYHVRRIRAPIFVALAGVFLVLISLLNVFRGAGIDAVQTLVSGLTLENIRELSGFKQDINVLYPFGVLWDMRARGALQLEYGMNYLFMLLTAVPRFVWPGKPNTSFESRYTLLVQGGLTGDSGGASVWTFTAWGEGYAQFAVAGVLLNLFLYGYVIRRCKDAARSHPDLVLVWLYMSVMLATYLRAGFQALFILALNMMPPAVWIVRRRFWGPSSSGGAGAATPPEDQPERPGGEHQ